MNLVHILDSGYNLSDEVSKFITKYAFRVVPFGTHSLSAGDILFGRWGLEKANALPLATLKQLKLTCPMTNVGHISPRTRDAAASFFYLTPNDPELRNVRSSGEYTFLLCLLAMKGVMAFAMMDRQKKIDDRFANWCAVSGMMREYSEPRVGIIGMGRNGGAVATMLENLGTRCFYFDPFVDLNLQHRPSIKDLQRLFEIADYIVITMSSNSNTRHLLDFDKLCAHRRKVSIINTSRPDLVEENGLLKALRDNRIVQYFSDFPLNDLNVLDAIESDSSLKGRFFWTNHLGGAAYNSAALADRLVLKKAMRHEDL